MTTCTDLPLARTRERTRARTSPMRGRAPAKSNSKACSVVGGWGVGIFPASIAIPEPRLTGWKEGTAKLPHPASKPRIRINAR